MRNQNLYKSPDIEVYGHCRLLLPWLRVPNWFFLQSGVENCWHGRLGIKPTTLDLSPLKVEKKHIDCHSYSVPFWDFHMGNENIGSPIICLFICFWYECILPAVSISLLSSWLSFSFLTCFEFRNRELQFFPNKFFTNAIFPNPECIFSKIKSAWLCSDFWA